MTEVKLEAQQRDETGTSASRRLRRENKVPVVVYAAGKKNEELRLSVDKFALDRVFGKAEFRKEIVALVVGKKEYKVKLKAFMRHPIRDDILHLDFMYAV